MMTSKMDLVLHPIRMQILMVVAGREMTPGQMTAALPKIAPATLYRHVKALAEGGLLSVVEERQIRGTVEKVYALARDAARLSDADIVTTTKAEHAQYFLIFLATLLQDFESYLMQQETEPIVLGRDGVIYSKAPLSVTDKEYAELARQMQTLVAPYIVRGDDDRAGRKRYQFTTIVIPQAESENGS